MSDQSKSKRKNYKQISQQVRQQIIESILNQGQNIKEVSSRIGVNISTCKAIIKVYQQEGRIGKKKNRNKVHTVIQTFSFFTLNNSHIEQIGPTQIEQSKISFERNEDFEQHLKANSKVKSEQILKNVIEEKTKYEEAALESQRKLMQCYLMQARWLSHFSVFPQNNLEAVKQGTFSLRQNVGISDSQL